VKITFLSAYFLRPFFPDKTFFVLNWTCGKTIKVGTPSGSVNRL
jgi:hypothetical protein